MGTSTRKLVVSYVVVAVLGLRLVYLYARPVDFWVGVRLVSVKGIRGGKFFQDFRRGSEQGN